MTISHRKGGSVLTKITLAAARVNRNLTQAELADMLGVSRLTVHEWENGKRAVRPINLYALCRVLDMSEDDILLPETITKSN